MHVSPGIFGTALAAAVLVSACVKTPAASTLDEAPERSRTRVAVQEKPAPQEKSSVAQRAPASSIRLELGYNLSVIVPAGSDLSVRVEDATGKTVAEQKSKTTKDAPPYVLDVPIKAALSYPLTIRASLVSSLGQEFSETRQVKRDQIKSGSPVTIDMK